MRSNRSGRDLQDEAQREAWVADLWRQLDRDHSGSVTRMELDCEAFHEVIRLAICPDRAATGGTANSRAELNMRDAIEFCLRKADQNTDASLSWPEFRSLVLCLSNPRASTGDLAFSLFDLDGSGSIDIKEFRELLRFYLGRNATAEEFREEWLLITSGSLDNANATRAQYAEWVSCTLLSAVCQHNTAAPGSRGGNDSALNFLCRSTSDRAKWTKRLASGPNPGHLNDAFPQGTREYFLRAQTDHELDRFYDTFNSTGTFTKQKRALNNPETQRRYAALLPKVLSSEGGTPQTMPERHGPAGTMRHHKTGKIAIWEDNFITPERFRRRTKAADRPLAPRATFGEVRDACSDMRRTAPVRTIKKSWSAPTLTGMGAAKARERVHPGIEDKADIRASRITILGPVPW